MNSLSPVYYRTKFRRPKVQQLITRGPSLKWQNSSLCCHITTGCRPENLFYILFAAVLVIRSTKIWMTQSSCAMLVSSSSIHFLPGHRNGDKTGSVCSLTYPSQRTESSIYHRDTRINVTAAWTIVMMCVRRVSGLTSSNVTSEGQHLPAATDSDPQTNRPRLPVGRPRLAAPTASGLLQDNSNYDDGLTNYSSVFCE